MSQLMRKKMWFESANKIERDICNILLKKTKTLFLSKISGNKVVDLFGRLVSKGFIRIHDFLRQREERTTAKPSLGMSYCC